MEHLVHTLAATAIVAFLILFLYQNQGNNHAITGSLPSHMLSSIAVKHNNRSPAWWDGGDCGCKGAHNNMVTMGVVGGTCGTRAWAAGYGQKVIAYTLYGNTNTYFKGFGEILKQAELLYPEYYVRLYIEATDQIKQIICPLVCQFPRLHVCNVKALPIPLGDVTKRVKDDPRMWRFLPLGDPQVEVMLARDLDSKILAREVSAVEEWLASGVALHVMRDSPLQRACVLAGLFGVRTDLSSLTAVNTQVQLAELREQLLKISKGKHIAQNDQNTLKDVVWKSLKDSSMRHESYYCQAFPNSSRPFPTKRQDMDYVGAQWYRFSTKIPKKDVCPSKCRPQDHLDWLYC